MAEEIIFKTGVDTGNSVKEVNKLEKSLKDVSTASTQVAKTSEDSLKELNAKVNSGTMSYQQMTKAVKDYQTIALTAGRTSAVGQQALQDASQLKDKLIDLDNEVKRLADDQKNLKGAMELSSTVVAGYGAVKGAMALTGIESESLQKSMVKLQAAQTLLSSLDRIRTALQKESSMMMLLQSVRTKILTASQYLYTTAVGTTTGAMKALKLAMLAIPIVAILAGIGALIKMIMWFASEEEKAEKQNEALTASYEKQQKAFERLSAKMTKDMDNRIALAKSEGATREEIHLLEMQRLKEQEAMRVKATGDEYDKLKDKQEIYRRFIKEGNDERAKEIGKEIRDIREKYKDLKALDGQYAVDKKILENNANAEKDKEDESKRKENADKAKTWRDKQKAQEEADAKLKLERERVYQDLMVQNIEDEFLRKATAFNIAQEREREALIQKYGKDKELLDQLDAQQASERIAFNKEMQDTINENLAESKAEQLKKDTELAELDRTNKRAQLEGELITMREDFEMTQALKAELALLEMETALAQENLTEGEKFKIKEEYKSKILALEEQSAERTKQINKDAMESGIGFAEQGTKAVQQLSDMLFSSKGKNLKKGSAEEEKHARKQFQINKALQLSMAVVDGFRAITTSLAQSPIAIGPIPNPAGIASLAFASLTTGINILKIASSKFSGTSGGGGGASMPTVTAPNIPSQADISGGTDNESTLTSGLTDNNASSNKVVLVDSDIKTGLDNESRVDVISTIG